VAAAMRSLKTLLPCTVELLRPCVVYICHLSGNYLFLFQNFTIKSAEAAHADKETHLAIIEVLLDQTKATH